MAAPKQEKAPRNERKALKRQVVATAKTISMVDKDKSAKPIERSKVAASTSSAAAQARVAGVKVKKVDSLIKKGVKAGNKVKDTRSENITATRDKAAAGVTAAKKQTAVKAQTKAAKTYGEAGKSYR